MLNQNQKQRDKLLFENSIVPYGSGVARFEKASLTTIKQLISLKFLDPEDRQSNSPCAKEFLTIASNLIKSYPKLAKQIYFHGYVIDKSREDYRATLEGIGISRGVQDVTSEMKIQLKLLFRKADDIQFDSGEFWCWYD